MGLFGPSRADTLEHQLDLERDERVLLINYVRNLERLCASEMPGKLAELQAAHRESREDAYRDIHGELNFSRRPNFRTYTVGMLRRGFEVVVAEPL